tara:strand:+ start:192 stop:422 length:231 start_codon:yes stop_codon:yes gene_type:complete
MKHWKTKEPMGNGFSHNQKEHELYSYNYLQQPADYELNTMRTHYLIRDVWDLKQLTELSEFIIEIIEGRYENGEEI